MLDKDVEDFIAKLKASVLDKLKKLEINKDFFEDNDTFYDLMAYLILFRIAFENYYDHQEKLNNHKHKDAIKFIDMD